MRNLILYRKRSLACFGIPYYCLFKKGPGPEQVPPNTYTIQNGQTAIIPIPEQPQEFCVMIPADSGDRLTPVVTIPAGTQDVEYTIITYYNGYKTLDFYLEEGKQL